MAEFSNREVLNATQQKYGFGAPTPGADSYRLPSFVPNTDPLTSSTATGRSAFLDFKQQETTGVDMPYTTTSGFTPSILTSGVGASGVTAFQSPTLFGTGDAPSTSSTALTGTTGGSPYSLKSTSLAIASRPAPGATGLTGSTYSTLISSQFSALTAGQSTQQETSAYFPNASRPVPSVRDDRELRFSGVDLGYDR